MIQILVVDDREEFTKNLKINLLRYLNISAIIRDNPQEATEILDLIPDIKLILTRSFINNQNTASIINNFIKTKEREISIFAYESMETAKNLMKIVAQKLDIPLSLDKVDSTAALKNAFHHIPIMYFDSLSEAPCDIYIRIGKDKNSHRFVKRINQFDPIPEELISRLKISDVSELFIHNDYHDNFMTYLSNMVADGLTDTSLPIKERMVHQARAFKFIHQFANELKVDDRLVEVVESSINSLGDSVKNHKPLNELINEVLSHKEGHLFQGAYLTNIMSLHLLKQESMDQEDNINQIIFASLFSDIGMSNPIMYLTSTDEQLNSNFEKNQWTEDEFKQVRHHPKNNAQLLENYPNISRKALRIIQEHHGSDLGIGFNLKPEDSISDLSKIFLTANCFILNFLNPLNKFNKKEIIEMIQSQGDKRIQELVAHFNKKIQ